MRHRKVQFKWGVFETKQEGSTVQMDVAPCDPKGILAGHSPGPNCSCNPSSGKTESNIPLFIHHREGEPRWH